MSWNEIELADVCEIGRGSSPRPINNKAYFEGGEIPWIKIADATNSFKVIFKTKEYVNSYGASFSRLLPVDSLIVAASGTLGFPMFLGVEGCIHDGWLYFKSYNGIDKNFLYYKIIDLNKYFYSKAYGAAIQNINTDTLRRTKINLPPLPTQKRIASILSTYDDLIENNLKRIKLLEETAQNIYKEWLVIFVFRIMRIHHLMKKQDCLLGGRKLK
jgi:type I restriction enzyme, S subunit